MTVFPLQRRVAALGPPRGFASRHALARAEVVARRADLPLDGAAALRNVAWLYAGCIAAAVTFFGVRGALVAPVVTTGGLIAWVRRRERGRMDRIGAAFPNAVHTMAGALRAGLSLRQALEVAAADAVGPLQLELAAAVRSCELGTPVVSVLRELSERCPVAGASLLANAASVTARSGAHLPPVFDAIVEAARDRAQLAQEMRAATAQGRSTATVVAALPFAFLALMGAGARAELHVLFGEPAGWVLLGLGATFEAAGFAWMRKLVRRA